MPRVTFHPVNAVRVTQHDECSPGSASGATHDAITSQELKRDAELVGIRVGVSRATRRKERPIMRWKTIDKKHQSIQDSDSTNI